VQLNRQFARNEWIDVRIVEAESLRAVVV